MPPRLRTKSGCYKCRKRRKKCDELKPVCTACRRLGLLCSYDEEIRTEAGPSVIGVLDKFNLRLDDAGSVVVARPSQHMALSSPNFREPGILDILHCYNDHWAARVKVMPADVITNSLLGLLPMADADQIVFSSLLAVLSVYMPPDWQPRDSLALKLVSNATTTAATALAVSSRESRMVPKHVLLSVGLLYLYSIHAKTSAEQRKAFLYGIGIILKQRTLFCADMLLAVPYHSLESYVYHMTTTSTVNFDLVVADTPVNYVGQVTDYLSRCRKVSVTDLSLLGVPATLLNYMFSAAHLRHKIMTANIDLEALHLVKSLIPKAESFVIGPQHAAREDSVAILTEAAFQHYARFLIAEADLRLTGIPTPQPVYTPGETVYENLALVAVRDHPYEILTWAFLMLGLGEDDWTRRALIRRAVRAQIDNSRLASGVYVLAALEQAWITGCGLQILLTPAVNDISF